LAAGKEDVMRVAVSGSHGLIGSALVGALRAEGHEVTRLVRGAATGPDEVRWDPVAGEIDQAGLEGHDAVVHLAGAGIGDRRWTAAYKREIRDSRVRGTALLAGALARLERPPSVLVSGSAIGIYGDRGDEELDESSPPGTGFLAEVCRAWEEATTPAADAGIRVALARTGVVLAREGGALRRMALPFRFFVGGPLGSGRQWFSWISLADEVAAIRHVIETPSLTGPVNLVAPGCVRQREFARALGRAMRRPSWMAVPAVALRLAVGRELAAELLASQRVRPAALLASGYRFHHPTPDAALAAAFSATLPPTRGNDSR
jgi:uncharacterized protein (TIGR01777 family)